MGADGSPLRGEFSSADASALSEAASRLTLYGARSTASVTLNANDSIAITDIVIRSAAALFIQIYDGADNTVGAGETLFAAAVPANDTVTHHFATPVFTQLGSFPKVKASAIGQVNVTMSGLVLRTLT